MSDIIIEQKENITPNKKEDDYREDIKTDNIAIKDEISDIKELKNVDIEINKEKEYTLYHINRDSDDDEIEEILPSFGKIRGGVIDRRKIRNNSNERRSIIQIKESTKHYVKVMNDFNKIQISSKKGFDYNTQFLYSSYIGETPIYQSSWNNNDNNNNNVKIDKKYNDKNENENINKEYKSNNNDMINDDIPTLNYLLIPIAEEEKSDEKNNSKQENISKGIDSKDNDSKSTSRYRYNSNLNRK